MTIGLPVCHHLLQATVLAARLFRFDTGYVPVMPYIQLSTNHESVSQPIMKIGVLTARKVYNDVRQM